MTKTPKQQAEEYDLTLSDEYYENNTPKENVIAAFLAGYSAGRNDALRWIPVSERLPEYQDWYSVVVDSTYRRKRICFFRAAERIWVDCSEKVTHWMMPLPKPPEVKP